MNTKKGKESFTNALYNKVSIYLNNKDKTSKKTNTKASSNSYYGSISLSFSYTGSTAITSRSIKVKYNMASFSVETTTKMYTTGISYLLHLFSNI